MRLKVLLILTLIIGIILILIHSSCSSTQSNVKLGPDFKFSDKQIITTYVVPSGNIEKDETYIRVLHLDFQARGYKVIDANEILKINFEKITATNHRQIADSLQSKNYLPSSDIYIIVSAVWDSAFVLTFYSEDRYVYWKKYQFAGMNVPTLNSRVSIYDRSMRDPIKSYTASDTTYLLSENDNSDSYYREYPWMVIAKQLSRELEDIPICSIVDNKKATNLYKVSFWVDKSYRDEFPDTWMDRLKLRTLYANDILRSQLDIELSQLEFVEWNSNFDRDLKNSIEKLYQSTTSNPGSLQIGITLDHELKRNWTDKSKLGIAYLLSTDAAITAQPSFPSIGQYWNPIEESITLVHEIAHILGAIHVPDNNSIMYPNAGTLSYEFDEVNKKIIGATKKNFLKQSTKERLIPYSEELLKVKDYPSDNSNPIIQATSSVIQLIDQRSKIIYDNPDKTFSNMFRLIPDSALVFAVVGYLEFKDNNNKSAINSFIRSIEINPDFAEAHYYLSLVFRKDGNDEQAALYKNLAKPYSKLWIIDRY